MMWWMSNWKVRIGVECDLTSVKRDHICEGTILFPESLCVAVNCLNTLTTHESFRFLSIKLRNMVKYVCYMKTDHSAVTRNWAQIQFQQQTMPRKHNPAYCLLICSAKDCFLSKESVYEVIIPWIRCFISTFTSHPSLFIHSLGVSGMNNHTAVLFIKTLPHYWC